MARLPEQRRSAADWSDRFILVVSGLAGAAGIVVLKVYGDHWVYDEFMVFSAAIWAAAVLLVYAFAVRLTSHTQVEPETTGDNCYYLGFVFTLVSLALTLFQLGSFDTQSDILRDIISGFGIALSSTIVGIALRVWFFQQRTDLLARDRETRIDIQKTAREFRTALAQSAVSLKQFTTESVQLTAERDYSLRQSTDELIKQQLDASKQIISELDEIVAKHRSSLEANAENIAETVERTLQAGFESASADAAKIISDGVANGLSELSSSAARLSVQLDQLAENDLRAISELGTETAEVWSKIEALSVSAISASVARTDSLHKAAADTVRIQLTEIRKLQHLSTNEMDSLRSGLAHLAAQIEQSKEQLNSLQASQRQLNRIARGNAKPCVHAIEQEHDFDKREKLRGDTAANSKEGASPSPDTNSTPADEPFAPSKILEMAAKGYSAGFIGRRLGISEQTAADVIHSDCRFIDRFD